MAFKYSEESEGKPRLPYQFQQWRDLGQKWLKDEVTIDGWSLKDSKGEYLLDNDGKPIKRTFLPTQHKFINSKTRYILYSGGLGCGKSDILMRKVILLSAMFANNLILFGRVHYKELDVVSIPEFLNKVPPNWGTFHKATRVFNFYNGSSVIFFHLDVMQEGSLEERKKALAEIASLNLGGFAIDQAEEIEFDIFEALTGRLRREDVPFRQGMLSSNPSLNWLFSTFKQERKEGYELFEASMLENAKNLPEDYLKDQLSKPEAWVKRFVHGQWDIDLLSDRAVIALEYRQKQKPFVKEPIRTFEGFEIFQDVVIGDHYQVGVDPAEGTGGDIGAISVRDLNSGEQVATGQFQVPPEVLGEKAKTIARLYNNAKIIPEINGLGLAVLDAIKKDYFNIYQRKSFDKFFDVEKEVYGWRTTVATKPLLIDNYLTCLREHKIYIRDSVTYEQMQSFVWSDDVHLKGAGAKRPFHDDALIADMLACLDMSDFHPEFFPDTLLTNTNDVKVDDRGDGGYGI